MTLHDTIIINFMLLLRAGAFGIIKEDEGLVPMSPHKWRVLVKVGEELKVLPYLNMALPLFEKDENLHNVLREELAKRDTSMVELDTSSASLYNHWTQKHWEEVREEEMNSHDISEDTLRLLDLIIYNADAIIVKDVNVEGLIVLGRFMMDHSSTISYDKLSQWLSRIGLVQIASLEGSMLVSAMGLKQENLPIVNKVYRNSQKLFMNSIVKVFEKHSFSNFVRMDVAMLETLSNRFVRAITLVTDIEE